MEGHRRHLVLRADGLHDRNQSGSANPEATGRTLNRQAVNDCESIGDRRLPPTYAATSNSDNSTRVAMQGAKMNRFKGLNTLVVPLVAVVFLLGRSYAGDETSVL